MRLRIVFMGTPSFAAFILNELLESKYSIVGVVTAPDRRQGRGRLEQASAVKIEAQKHEVPVLQPENLKDPSFLKELSALKGNLFVVVAFRMLPKVIWNLPQYGTFNLHASLLPQYRGAAPINWAIMNGDNETGVTTFFIDDHIDTGEIIYQEAVKILPQDNAGSLHDKLMKKGSELIMRTIEAIDIGEVTTISQKFSDLKELKTAPKLFKEDCKIDWSKDGREIWNKIRGLSPYPAAWSELKNKKTSEVISFKLFDVELLENMDENNDIAKIISDGKTELIISTKGYEGLKILELQLSGKRRMKVDELLRGFDINAYELNL